MTDRWFREAEAGRDMLTLYVVNGVYISVCFGMCSDGVLDCVLCQQPDLRNQIIENEYLVLWCETMVKQDVR